MFEDVQRAEPSSQTNNENDDDADSLFDEEMPSPPYSPQHEAPQLQPIAKRAPPSIPGLYFNPEVKLPDGLAVDLLTSIKDGNYFRGGRINQIMLFERGHDGAVEGLRAGPGVKHPVEMDFPTQSTSAVDSAPSRLPSFLNDLLDILSSVLEGHIPQSTHRLLFPPGLSDSQIMHGPLQPHPPRRPARQAILNLYRPGEGITPHIDLLQRFGDGIIVVSLGSGIAMQFARPSPPSPPIADATAVEQSQDMTLSEAELWLEPGSILVLEGEARYEWTHGIMARDGDWVENSGSMDPADPEDDFFLEDPITLIPRDIRVSITLRWLLPGAEIVGAE